MPQLIKVGSAVTPGSWKGKDGVDRVSYRQKAAYIDGIDDDMPSTPDRGITVPDVKGIAPGVYEIDKPFRMYGGKVEANWSSEALGQKVG